MSPCCLAAATATAALTALAAVGLTAFVLVTDACGLVVLIATTLAATLQRLGWIAPSPGLLYGLEILLGLRAAWLLATSRRALVVGVARSMRRLASTAARHVWT